MTGLSFLGTGRYDETTYIYGDKSATSVFFPAAMKELFGVDDLAVVMTREAAKIHGDALAELTQFREIRIPSGMREEEYFEMFDAIVKAIPPDKPLVVDVTHGFRSLPMIALSSVIFLRFHKSVDIAGIYYGAFDARDRHTNQTPVFNLLPFLDIIDWTFAMRRFSEKGDATDLAHILHKLHVKTHLEKAVYRSKELLRLGTHLNNLMNAMAVIRPNEVLDEAAYIHSMLDDVAPDLERIRQTRPLALLFDDLRSSIEAFRANELSGLFSSGGLRMQASMLKQYIAVSQYQQALTLAVELLISVACLKNGFDPVDKECRKEASVRIHRIAVKEISEDIEEWEKKLADILPLASEFRNDINHAGIRGAPKPTGTLIEKTGDIIRQTLEFIDIHAL